MSLYKIYTYEINSSTTIKDLQLLIQKNTTIEAEHQVLTDYNGTVVNESIMSLASQTNVRMSKYIIYVYI